MATETQAPAQGEFEAKGRGKSKWTTIKVPAELRDAIKAAAKNFGVPEYRVIWWGVSFFVVQLSRPRIKESLPLLDKSSWYIAKLAMSVGELKAKPSPENIAQLSKTAMQVAERLGVDTTYLIKACEHYVRNPDTDTKMEVNAALKMVILDIMWKAVKEEGEALFTIPEKLQSLIGALEQAQK